MSGSLKRKVISILNNSWLCPYLQKFRRRDYIHYYKKYCRTEKVKEKRVLMLSDSRDSIDGNFEFLDKELKRRGYEVTYFLKRTLKDKKTVEEKKSLCKLMAQAHFIILDDFYPIIYPIKIRNGTELIQVWHAIGAFKTVGFSRIGKPGGPNPRSLTHRNYSAAIVSSESVRKNYAEAFGIPVERIYATGIPRTDVFFDNDYKVNIRKKIYCEYPQLVGKRIVLFAPTFRGNGQNTAYYDFKWINFSKIKEALGEQYCFLIKMHPFIKNLEELPEDDDFFLNITSHREINDFLFVTDVLITDYSSVIFEGALLDLNTVFFVPDLAEYILSRDFYYPFDDYMFGRMAKNEDELIEAIKEPDNDPEKREQFKVRFCEACDGKSTERVVENLFIGENG